MGRTNQVVHAKESFVTAHQPAGRERSPPWPQPPSPGSAASPPLVHEAVELGGVLADDLVPGVSGQMAELLPDVFLRIRPDAVRVREVRGPHNVALADLLDELDADRVGLIGRIALAPPVFTRRHLELELFELILPLGIHAVEHVGDPADPSLADDDLEAGMALEHAAEDHR